MRFFLQQARLLKTGMKTSGILLRGVHWHLSRLMTKPSNWPVRPAKTQISLGIHPVWSESSLCVQWVAKDPRFLHADNEDSDPTGLMPRLIWVFAWCTCNFVGFVLSQLIYFCRNHCVNPVSSTKAAWFWNNWSNYGGVIECTTRH